MAMRRCPCSIARAPRFQLHCAEKRAVKWIAEHDVRFLALVLRLRDDHTNELGLDDALRAARAERFRSLIRNVVQLFRRGQHALARLGGKGQAGRVVEDIGDRRR